MAAHDVLPSRSKRHSAPLLGRRIAVVAALVLFLASVPAPGAQAGSGAPASLALSATPSTLLVDQQSVTVAGSGYPAGATVFVVQCLPGLGVGGCNTSAAQQVVADAGGAFSTPFTVTRLLRIGATTTDCAVAGACILAGGLPPDGTTFAAADIQFDPSVPLPPAPAITATPDTGLLDRQAVTVTGSAFPPGQVVVFQCVAIAVGPNACAQTNVTFAAADAGGAFTATIDVRRLIRLLLAGTADCAVPGTCILAAAPTSNALDWATTPIAFDPNGPLPPVPAATVEPSTSLTDGQVVTVAATGFEPMASVGVVQCVTGGPPDGRGCDQGTYLETPSDAQGALRTSFAVRAALDTQLGRIDCTAEPGACVVVVVWVREIAVNAQVRISFGTTAPSGPATAVPVAAPAFTG